MTMVRPAGKRYWLRHETGSWEMSLTDNPAAGLRHQRSPAMRSSTSECRHHVQSAQVRIFGRVLARMEISPGSQTCEQKGHGAVA